MAANALAYRIINHAGCSQAVGHHLKQGGLKYFDFSHFGRLQKDKKVCLGQKCHWRKYPRNQCVSLHKGQLHPTDNRFGDVGVLFDLSDIGYILILHKSLT